MKEDSNNSGTLWNDTKMHLLGTRVSWVVVPWGNMLLIRKDFRLAEHRLEGCPIRKRPK